MFGRRTTASLLVAFASIASAHAGVYDTDPGTDPFERMQQKGSAHDGITQFGTMELAQADTQPANLPPVTVEGDQGALNEEKPVGKYGQPEWTAHRRFPGTRIYVLPEDTIEAEYWNVSRLRRRNDPDTIENMAEIEFGLPAHFQLDLYAIARTEEDDKTYFDQQIELRWALADWGKIWGNPTFYVEYRHFAGEDPDKLEGKILFGGEIAPRWHWGTNLVAEHEMGGDQANEWALTLAASYTVLDEKLSLGLESEFSFEDTKQDRGNFESDILLGPSIQWRPFKKLHIDVAPLFGLTSESKNVKFLANIGWEF